MFTFISVQFWGFFSMLSAVLAIFLKTILTRNINAGIWFLVLFIKSQRPPPLTRTYWFPCKSDWFATPSWAVSLRNGSHPEQDFIYWNQSFMCTTQENIFSVENYLAAATLHVNVQELLKSLENMVLRSHPSYFFCQKAYWFEFI